MIRVREEKVLCKRMVGLEWSAYEYVVRFGVVVLDYRCWWCMMCVGLWAWIGSVGAEGEKELLGPIEFGMAEDTEC